MPIRWKRKKRFDGKTCGVQGCTRKTVGYWWDRQRCTANPKGRSWYGPICQQCADVVNDEDGTAQEPEPLFKVFADRQRVEGADQAMQATADVLGIELEDLQSRLEDEGLLVDTEGTPSPEQPSSSPLQTQPDPSAKIKEAADFATETLELVEAFHILGQEHFELAARVICEANEKRKVLEELLKDRGAEHKQALAELNAQFKGPLELLAKVEQALKDKVAAAQKNAAEQQQLAVQRAAQLAQQGHQIAATQASEEAKASALQLPATLQSADRWDFEVTNPLEIPRQYLAVDAKAVRKALKEGQRDIPGLRIFQKAQIKVAPK